MLPNHLPRAPNTGAVLHLWSLVTHVQHFNSVASAADMSGTEHAGSPGEHGEPFGEP